MRKNLIKNGLKHTKPHSVHKIIKFARKNPEILKMNNLFVIVFAVAIGASYGFFIDNLPFLCKADKDCGAHKCCAFGRVCFPKIGANMPCGGKFSSIHKCGCDDGLECQVTQVINVTVAGIHKVMKIRQCRAAGETVIPEVVEYEADEPRQKRGLLTGINNIVNTVSNTLLRKCSQSSDCGVKRCCANFPVFGKRCILPLPWLTLCNRNGHCCGENLECRDGVLVTHGKPGGEINKPVHLQFCQKPSEPPVEVEEE